MYTNSECVCKLRLKKGETNFERITIVLTTRGVQYLKLNITANTANSSILTHQSQI